MDGRKGRMEINQLKLQYISYTLQFRRTDIENKHRNIFSLYQPQFSQIRLSI